MRFRLTLRRLSKPCNIPMNYQPYITASIYQILEKIDPQYSDFLHNEGYQDKHKRFKYFTFGQLQIPRGKWQIEQGRMLIYADKITLIVSFWIDKAMETFVMGLFQNQKIEIIDKFAHNVFEVAQIEAIPDKIDRESLRFRTLTPLVVKKLQANGRNYDYLSPTEQGYEQIFIDNLLSKYTAYLQYSDGAQMSTSQTTPAFKLLNAKQVRSKLITVKPAQNIRVRGYLFDFELTAPKELLQIGYFGGFGSNNAQGFGCVRVLEE